MTFEQCIHRKFVELAGFGQKMSTFFVFVLNFLYSHTLRSGYLLSLKQVHCLFGSNFDSHITHINFYYHGKEEELQIR